MPELPPGFYVGRVYDVHPNTHTIDVQVYYSGSAHIIYEVPLLLQGHDPDLSGGATYLPKSGSNAVISTFTPDGVALCIGFVKGSHEIPVSDDAATSPDARVAEDTVASVPPLYEGPMGSKDPLLGRSGESSYRGGDPGEAYPGDWIRRSSSGNAVAVLEGGVSIFKGSDLSKIEAIGLGDLLRVVAGDFEFHTALGTLTIKSEGNKASLKLKANSDITRLRKGEFSIEAGIADGSDILYFSASESGNPIVSFRVTATGDVLVNGNTIHVSQNTESGETSVSSCYARKHTTEGDDLLHVFGDYAVKASGVEISANPEAEVDPPVQEGHILVNGPNAVNVVSGGAVSIAAGKSQETILGFVPGKDLAPTPLLVAKQIDISNGSFITNIGNPAALGVPSAMSTYEVNTYSGDIRFNAGPIGSIVLNSWAAPSPKGTSSQHGIHLNAASVMIGAPPTGPICAAPPKLFQAVLYEPLIAYLTELHTWLDAHTHIATGPTAPTGPAGAGVTGPSSVLTGNYVAFASKFVQLGG